MKKFTKVLVCIAACLGIDLVLGYALSIMAGLLGNLVVIAILPVIGLDVFLMVKACKGIWRCA